MPRATHVQTNFTAGEISPRLLGRSDLNRYQNGLEKAENAIIYPHGMIARRPGTKFVGFTKNNGVSRLIPFEYNDDQAYVIEFGNEYLRFFRDGIPITRSISITTASWSAELATYTSTAHGLAVGDYVSVSGVDPVGYNAQGTVVSVPGANQFTLRVLTNPGSYVSGGSAAVPYELASPWTSAELADINYTQSADVLYVMHPNFAPRRITRIGADVFSISTFEIKNGPFEPLSQTAKIRVSVTGHDATAVDSSYITWGGSAQDWAGDEAGEHLSIKVTDGSFSFEHGTGVDGPSIGRLIKFKKGVNPFKVGLIYQTISNSQAYILVLSKGQAITTFVDYDPSTDDTAEWYLGDFYGSFSDTTHTRVEATNLSFSSPTVTITTARKHTVEVGDSITLQGSESTTDINGVYTVTGTPSTTTIEVTASDPGTVASSGTVIMPAFLSNDAQEGTPVSMNQPKVPSFFQQRLWLGGTTNNVNRIYASVTGDFNNFQEADLDSSYETLDTDSLNITIDDDRVNVIRWMRSVAQGLIVGTNGAEYTIGGATTGSVVTPSSVRALRQTEYGSKAGVEAELVGRSLLFAHRSGTRLIELAYSFEADQQVGTDMSIVSEHLLKPGIKAMSYQEVPVQTMWIVLDNGDVIGFVFEKEQDVLGWTKCNFGNNGLAESVAVIPETDEDAPWFIVNRGGVRTIEVMQPPFDVDTEQVDAWYVDAGLRFDARNTDSLALLKFNATSYGTGSTGTLSASGTLGGAAFEPFAGDSTDLGERFRMWDAAGNYYDLEITVDDSATSCTARVITSGFPAELQNTNTSSWADLVSSITGFDHLDGEVVKVFADGGHHEDATISATGTLTLNGQYAEVVAGYGYTTTIKSVPIRVLQYFTETRGKYKSLYNAELRLWKSLGGSIDFNDQDTQIEYRQRNAALGLPPAFYSGLIEESPRSSYDGEAFLRVTTDAPMPFNILSIVYEIDINAAI